MRFFYKKNKTMKTTYALIIISLYTAKKMQIETVISNLELLYDEEISEKDLLEKFDDEYDFQRHLIPRKIYEALLKSGYLEEFASFVELQTSIILSKVNYEDIVDTVNSFLNPHGFSFTFNFILLKKQ